MEKELSEPEEIGTIGKRKSKNILEYLIRFLLQHSRVKIRIAVQGR